MGGAVKFPRLDRNNRVKWAVACLLALLFPGFLWAQPGTVVQQHDANNPTIRMPYNRVKVLSIGVQDYANAPRLRDLRFAIRDAVEIANVFRDYYKYEVVVLHDPTRQQILGAIDEARQDLGPEDGFILFFAGHGVSTPASMDSNGVNVGYFVPRITTDLSTLKADDVPDELRSAHPFRPPERLTAPDGSPAETEAVHAERVASAKLTHEGRLIEMVRSARLHAESVRMDELRRIVDALPSKHTVCFFDACFSGLAASTRAADPTADALAADAALIRRYGLLDTPSRAMLTAGSGGEEALEHDQGTRGFREHHEPTATAAAIPHGVFTYELLEILRGVGPDGMQVHELAGLMMDRVSYVASTMDGRRMTPQLREYPAFQRGDPEIRGGFVFVPDPTDRWLLRVEQAILRRANQAGGMSRGEIDEVLNSDREQRRREDDLARLEAKAMIVLAARDSKLVEAGLPVDEVFWSREREQLERRASLGDEDAMAAMFYAAAYGLGKERDPGEATGWLGELLEVPNADAKFAYATALRQGIGFDANERGHEQLAQEAERIAQQGETSVAAAGLAVVSAREGNAAGFAAGLGLFVAALTSRNEASLERTIALMDHDVRRLFEAQEALERTGTSPMPVFEQIRGNLHSRLGTVRTLNHARTAGRFVDTRPFELVKRVERAMSREVNALQSAWRRPDPARAREVLRDIEFEYAKLQALLPYLLHNDSWSEQP